MSEILTIGDRGDLVKVLHQDLIEQGFFCGNDPADKIFGPATQSAVKLYQACHMGPYVPLVVDGIVGPDTWWAFNHPSGGAQSQTVGNVPAQEASNLLAREALDSARSELSRNVFEIPNGSNRGPRVDVYTGMEGKPSTDLGPPWCGYFVSWNFAKARVSPFGWLGGAQSIALFCLKFIQESVSVNGTLFSDQQVGTPLDGFTAHPGDLGVIANGQVHGHIFHIEAVQDNDIWTIEGNCGNAVRRMRRDLRTLRFLVNFDALARARGL